MKVIGQVLLSLAVLMFVGLPCSHDFDGGRSRPRAAVQTAPRQQTTLRCSRACPFSGSAASRRRGTPTCKPSTATRSTASSTRPSSAARPCRSPRGKRRPREGARWRCRRRPRCRCAPPSRAADPTRGAGPRRGSAGCSKIDWRASSGPRRSSGHDRARSYALGATAKAPFPGHLPIDPARLFRLRVPAHKVLLRECLGALRKCTLRWRSVSLTGCQ